MASQVTQPAKPLESANPAMNAENETKSPDGLRRFLHGITYQLKLSLLIFAHAYDLMQKDKNFTCTIATEDPNAGKFDDIVYRYCYNGVSNTICVQAKHKLNAYKIGKGDFIKKPNQTLKNPPFALLPYFTSFLEIKNTKKTKQSNEPNTATESNNQNQTESAIQEYVLTTNATIDDSLKSVLTSVTRKANIEIDNLFPTNEESQVSQQSSCYKFNWEELTSNTDYRDLLENLKECSECYTLAKFLAKIIFKQESLRTAHNETFKNAIVHNIIGSKKTKETYGIEDSFSNTNCTEPFRAIFEKEYKKLCGSKDVWQDVNEKGIIIPDNIIKGVGKSPKTPLPTDVVPESDLKEFFEQFILVCNTLNEDALDAKVIEKWEEQIVSEPGLELLRSATASENAYATMTQYVLDWMKVQQGKILGEKDIETLYKQIIRKIQFIQMQGITEKCLKELEKACIEIKPERLKIWTIYSELRSEDCKPPIVYRSGNDTALVALIVSQTLKLLRTTGCEYEYLFLDNESYWPLRPALQGIFKYLDQKVVLVVQLAKGSDTTMLKEHSEEMLKTVPEGLKAEKRKQKVMFIEQTESDKIEPDKNNIFYIRDVTKESKSTLYEKLKDALYFGTNVQLNEITEDTDPLQFLYEILKEQLLSED